MSSTRSLYPTDISDEDWAFVASHLTLLSEDVGQRRLDLRDHLVLKDANLSQHLSALESLGYVTIEKVFEKKRPRTWVSLSPGGRAAFEDYLGVLRRIVGPPLATPER